MSRGKVIIIQGGQWGSEGKGQIAAEIAGREGVAIAVRTGSINAGHTVYKDGKRFVMQIIPTAWVHPQIALVLGAGCYIEPEILANEVKMIKDATGEDVRKRLFIDHRCAWFGKAEQELSKQANRHHAMGATGKGCSEAIISKMRDRGDYINARARQFSSRDEDYVFSDTVTLLNEALRNGDDILLEGTQGALLDFITGPYPFVTSRMTSAAAWLAEAGLPPVNVDTVLVVRSHPIRVAGNSGPMPGEISWPILARLLNRRLGAQGLKPLVQESAIVEFETVLDDVVNTEYPRVADEIERSIRTQFHLWSDDQRSKFRVCLSEAHATTWKRLPEATQQALAFFEKTTVTKKLRRVADLNFPSVREAVMMNNPSRLAYTFLNYDYPELYNVTADDPKLHASHVNDRMVVLREELGVPVDYVSTGPLPEHVINVSR